MARSRLREAGVPGPPRAAPGSSLPLDAYRRLVPERLRRRVSERLPPGARDRLDAWLRWGRGVEQRLGRRRGHAAARRLARRRPDLLAHGRTVVVVGRSPKVAVRDEDLSGLRARAANLAAVCSALGEAGVDYFCVRGTWDRSSAVGVSEADRERVVAALAGLCRRLPGYLSDVTRLPAGSELPRESWPGFEARAWGRLGRAKVLRLTVFRTDRRGRVVRGTRYGCDVEFWAAEGDRLVEPRPNLAVPRIVAAGPPVHAPMWSFTRLASPFGQPVAEVRTRAELVVAMPEDVPFPIDVVYAGAVASAELLRYSLRSLHMYAPWVRRVYLVAGGAGPAWLAPTVRRVVMGGGVAGLRHIGGLSDHFLYLDDGTLFGTDVTPELFFFGNGISKLFSPAGPHPLRREVLADLAENEGAAGAVARHHELAFRTGRAAPGDIRHCRVDPSGAGAERELRLVAERDCHVIGLPASSTMDDQLRSFLDALCPVPSPYERSGPE